MAGLDSFVKLLVQANDIHDSTDITDESASAHTLYINSCINTNVESVVGTTSILGSNGIYTTDHADFTLGSDDWTWELWINRTEETALGAIFGQCNNSLVNTSVAAWFLSGDNSINVRIGHSGGTQLDVSGGSVPSGVWTHIAAVRYGDVFNLFVGGAIVATSDLSGLTVDDVSELCSFAKAGSYGDEALGYYDMMRLSVGVARYTEAFTPPTERFDDSGPPIEISGSFGFGCLAEGSANQPLQIGSDIGFSSDVIIDTKRIDSVAVGIGFGAVVEASATKYAGIIASLGFGASTDINIPQVYELIAALGFGAGVEIETIPGHEVSAGLGFGCLVDIASASDIDISASIGIGNVVSMKKLQNDCSMPSHDSTRWS